MNSNPNPHLEMPELARLLEQASQRPKSELIPAKMHPHFAVCDTCREQFVGLVRLDDQLKGARSVESVALGDCPAETVWGEITAGLTDPEETLKYIEHASRCDQCGPRLRAAVGELVDLNAEETDEERKQIANLASARPEWQLRLAERITGNPVQGRTTARHWWWFPGLAGLGAALVLIVAVGWWVTNERGTSMSANALLARAYTEQRTLELRLPGAAYAPLRVQRGPAESFVGRPATLLKAEALIAGQLAAHPYDPAWLQSAARADVLEGKYDAAVESLQRALELQPHSPELMADLGTAYFQRARSEGRQEDLGAAFEYFSQVLALQPENATALFNRAIVAEHQFLYRQALEDWEHYLKIDSRSEWAKEARNHEADVRSKLKAHEGGAGLLLTPAQVANAVSADANADLEQRIEQYLDAAVRAWLPQAYPDVGATGDRNAQRALFFLAELANQEHNDRWLTDLLQGSSAPAFPKAIAALARASQANYSGAYTISHEEAGTAARLFRASGNRAGLLRAQFEQVYSEQLTRRTNDCRHEATAALADAELFPYAWLQIQLGLEKGVCSFLLDDIGVDERLDRRSMERAEAVGYGELYLRALGFVADNQIQMGDLSGGLKSATSGLQRYWSEQLTARRGSSLYSFLGLAYEAENRPNLAVAIWREAAALIDSDDNLLSRAWAHSHAARAAATTHQLEIAQQHYGEASRLYGLAPQSGATLDYALENEIRAAQLEASSGQFESGITRLTGIQDQIRTHSNNYVVQMFYFTLGDLQLRGHHAEQAEQAFRPALELAEQGLRSLNSEAERIKWSKDAAPVYLGMSEAELVQGRTQESLEYFEWYLGAAGRSGESSRSGNRLRTGDLTASSFATQLGVQFTSRLPVLTGSTVVAFGALPDGLAIWTYDNRGVHAQWIPQSNQELQELAARFHALASDPKSEMSALRRDAGSLYSALISPVENQIEPGRSLVIEADGWLAQVPFEALLDASGHYLIERAPVVHSLGQSTDASLHESGAMTADLHALIVGSTSSSEPEGLIPLPDVLAEVAAVADDFQSPEVLTASEATLSAVERDLSAAAVFHFTGHSLTRPNGAGLMLESGGPQKGVTVLLNAARLRHLDLRHLQLAVLSTCNTESGNDGSRGFNSIAEALQRAGVPHVVASRWAVDSVEARQFVEGFYRNALSGQPVSEAMRRTSRSMMADPRTSHPYYWSAFSAYGRP